MKVSNRDRADRVVEETSTTDLANLVEVQQAALLKAEGEVSEAREIIGELLADVEDEFTGRSGIIGEERRAYVTLARSWLERTESGVRR